MSRRRPFLLLIAITLAACKAPEKPAPTQAAVIPKPEGRPAAYQCAFISDHEATQVFGVPYLAHPGQVPESGCYFQPAAGQAENIYLEIVPNTNGFYELTTQPDAEMVADLGDRAVWLSNARVLHVVDGNRTLRIRMGTGKTKLSDLITKAKGLARIAITRR